MNASGLVQQKIDLGAPAASAAGPGYTVKAESDALTRSYSTGTGANQIDLVHGKNYNLVATNTTLDLQALQLIDGTTGNFVRVRELFIRNKSNFPLTVGNAAATQWIGAGCPLQGATATFAVPPNGIYHWSDPTTTGATGGGLVAAGAKSLKLDAGANTVNFDLIIAGGSANA